MDASAGSSPPHSQENPPEHGGDMGEAPAEEIGGEAADDFMFAEDTFPSLPDFPCLSSPSSSTFSSSSSSNSSSAYTNTAGGAGGGADGAAGEPSEPASAGEGFDALDDIDQLLDFASLSMPWDSEPFPEVSMMLEDDMSAPPHPCCVRGWRSSGAEHAKVPRTRHGTRAERERERERDGSCRDKTRLPKAKSCGWLRVQFGTLVVEFLPHKVDAEEERTRTIMCSGAKAKAFLPSCMHKKDMASFSHRPERIKIKQDRSAGPVAVKTQEENKAHPSKPYDCARPVRMIPCHHEIDRRRATCYRARFAFMLWMMDHAAPSSLRPSSRLLVVLLYPSEGNGYQAATVLVHARSHPSIHLSPGRIMNRWVGPLACSPRYRLGFSQVNAHAGMRLLEASLGPGPAAITGSPPRRPPGPRRIGARGNWRVGFARPNEAIGVLKLPAITGSTQHLQLAMQ